MKIFSLEFVVFLSIAVYGRRYSLTQWISVFVVKTGVIIVSITSFGDKNVFEMEKVAMKDKETILGLIALGSGEFLLALQMIIEEYILKSRGG